MKPETLTYQFLLIGFGAIVGAILSFLATELSASRQRKAGIVERNKETSTAIIEGTLKFLFRANDILNDLCSDKQLWVNKKNSAEEGTLAQKYYQAMANRLDSSTSKSFFDELNYHSFRLKRLQNQNVWEDFEELMSTYAGLTKLIFKTDTVEECKEFDEKYKLLKKKFVDKCIDLTKI